MIQKMDSNDHSDESQDNFESIVCKSWQSFSTMKRFVAEAQRLENASWRLWFMKKKRNMNSESEEENVTDGFESYQQCIYCEMAVATLTCNGCCHDPYCATCFHLVHKKGHLASHTAQTIKYDRVSENSEPPIHGGKVDAARVPSPKEFSTTKSWEVQMDLLIKSLMNNSLHSDGDISVHDMEKPEYSALKLNEPVDEVQIMGNGNMVIKEEYENTIPSLSTTKRKKSIKCGNCRGPHMTIDCPKLAVDVLCVDNSNVTVSSPPKTDGVDTMLRKYFTTLHNNNNSNSTHAFLGDEISVHGGKQHTFRPVSDEAQPYLGEDRSEHRGKNGGFFSPEMFSAKESRPPSIPKCFSFSDVRSIKEDKNYDESCPICNHLVDDSSRCQCEVEIARNSTSPILPRLYRGSQTARCRGEWIVPFLSSDLPLDVLLQMRSETTIVNPSPLLRESSAIILLRTSGKEWHYRTVVLYRNFLFEYMIEKDDQDRPVGCVNVSEGSICLDSSDPLVIKAVVFKSSTREVGKITFQLRFNSLDEAMDWKNRLNQAVNLRLDTLYDLAPPLYSRNKGLELGKGRFSTVRRARAKFIDPKNGSFRDSALKIIDKSSFWSLVDKDVEREDTLYREVLTQGLLSTKSLDSSYCPVVRLLSVFETHDMLVMELELMEGGDMFDLLADAGSLLEKKAAYIIADLISGVQFCQENGVAHRDIKLANLALDHSTTTESQRHLGVHHHPSFTHHLTDYESHEFQASGLKFGSLKLADFGMAAFIRPDGTLLGRCGTPGYVAPEILLAGKHEAYNLNVDMFSAGAVLYTLLCGFEPFYGTTDKALMASNKAAEIRFDDPEWESISLEAKDLVTRMMKKNPVDRITPLEALKHPFIADRWNEIMFMRSSEPKTEYYMKLF